jgi:hypothetical protein
MLLGTSAFGQSFVFHSEFSTDYNVPYALAADSAGGIYYVTFEAASSRAVYVADPMNNPSSQVVITTATDFPSVRGLQGIAVDSSGNVYVSGDKEATWVKKFGPAPSFTEDSGFSIGSTNRLLGCDLLGDNVLGCVSFDAIEFFNTSNGDLITSVTGGQSYQRDLAFNSNNNDLYVAHNGAYISSSGSLWSGGTPASPAGYSFVKSDLVSMGGVNTEFGVGTQGIEYDAKNGRLLIANKEDQRLDIYTISGSGSGTSVNLFQTINGADSTGGTIGSIGDSVAIDKGSYTLLCITDFNGRILLYTAGLVTNASNWQLYY